ncbi:MAG: thioredoxin domain-containing protein [Thermoplasmatota archaeon]
MKTSKGGANRLISEKSPYLLQHANNPVDWFPWGEEAFKKARDEDKPIFLSIGYSTCHWCHVMERESFEDPRVAHLMNRIFVSIKVDREERPDIDAVYMRASQISTGSGGWPLTVLMTSQGKPFFLGSYIPRDDRFGMTGLIKLMERVEYLWSERREHLIESSDSIGSALSKKLPKRGEGFSDDMSDAAADHLMRTHDSDFGGFGSPPKFPSPHQLLFLMRYWNENRDDGILNAVVRTLTSMRRGGIYDHVGSGFHRYSTDQKWILPHFEKMLYDQAMHIQAYLEGYQITGSDLFRTTVEDIVEYVIRDLGSPEGGFYSSEDADSEGEEGKFYTWTVEEVEHVLGREKGKEFALEFNMERGGNFRDEASGKTVGSNILHLIGSDGTGNNREELQALFIRRCSRVRPSRDDKVLADWNGMMISAAAKAGRVLGRKDFIERASLAADFILDMMWKNESGLYHRYRDGETAVRGFLDDYAQFILSLLDLYESTFDVRYLREAIALTDEMIGRFRDPREGGFFRTQHDGEILISRDKDAYDGAYPSGNSAAMDVLVRVGKMMGRRDLLNMASEMGRTFSSTLHHAPWAHTYLLCGFIHAMRPSKEILIIGPEDDDNTMKLLEAVRGFYNPGGAAAYVRPGDLEIGKILPLSGDAVMIDGKPTAYVCSGWRCDVPTTDPAGLRELLDR